MGAGSLGPHCLCFQETCPLGGRREDGRRFGLLNCSLRVRGSQLPPRIGLPGCEELLPLPGLQLRVTQNQARGCIRDVPVGPKATN